MKKRRLLRYRSLRIRIILLVALTWLIPVLLLIFYADMQRRTKSAFEDGLRYAAELTGERLNKAAAHRPAEALLQAADKPADMRLVVLEPGGHNEFGLDGEYDAYYAQDRAALARRSGEVGESPVFMLCESGRLYLSQTVYAGSAAEATLFIELDRDYLFSYLLDNSYGATRVDITIGGAAVTLTKTASGLLGADPPNGEPIKAHGRDSSGSVGTGRAILHFYADMDKQTLLRDYYGFALVYQMFFIISPLLIIISVWLYRGVTSPIAKLVSAIRAVETGGFGAQVDGGGDDEFADLVRSFNSMSKGLADALAQARKQDEALSEARILALRSQINPHFINNTLEFINWKARLGDADGVSRMVAALSAMLDGAMGRERSVLLPLTRELDYAGAYLDIIALRFGEQVAVENEVDEAALGVPVPPLLLQPLLENAVNHGLEPRGGGRITLSARLTEGFLVLSVANDGALSAESEERIRRALGTGDGTERLGLRNVSERLRLIYGGEAAFSVTGDGERTAAEIRLPVGAS